MVGVLYPPMVGVLYPPAEVPTRLDADTTAGLVYPGLDALLLGESVSRIMSTNLTKVLFTIIFLYLFYRR